MEEVQRRCESARACALALVLVLLTVGLGACEGLSGPGPASLSLKFNWQEQPVQAVYIWVRVEHRAVDAKIEGPILASAGPALYDPAVGTVALALPEVPNGDDRVVVVEVRAGESSAERIEYFGVSEPFSLVPGKTTTVETELALQAPAQELGTVALTLKIAGVDVTAATTAAPRVTEADARSTQVLLTSVGAQKALVANDAGFTKDVRVVALDGSDPEVACEATDNGTGDAESAQVCTLDWSLLGQDGAPPEDTTLTVFAKLLDSYGYESEVLEASAYLDVTAPSVTNADLPASTIKPGGSVLLTVSADEKLDPAACSLSVRDEDGQDSDAFTVLGPTSVGSVTLLYTLVAADDVPEQGFQRTMSRSRDFTCSPRSRTRSATAPSTTSAPPSPTASTRPRVAPCSSWTRSPRS